ncbi:MAG: hypothetical protein U1D69_04100 [Polynucleobacter sp.]|nr:hypothetical protein [Polynucleobacter sp.]
MEFCSEDNPALAQGGPEILEFIAESAKATFPIQIKHVCDLAAYYCVEIIQRKPFVTANLKTALLTCLATLESHGHHASAEKEDMVQFASYLARGVLDKAKLAEFLKGVVRTSEFFQKSSEDIYQLQQKISTNKKQVRQHQENIFKANQAKDALKNQYDFDMTIIDRIHPILMNSGAGHQTIMSYMDRLEELLMKRKQDLLTANEVSKELESILEEVKRKYGKL